MIHCCHGKGPISFYSYESQITSSNFKRTRKHHPPMFWEGEGNSVLVSNNNVFHNFALVVKNPLANAGDTRDVGSIPGSRRSPEGGHGNQLQYSCLEDPMDRATRWATVHRVTKSWTRLKRLSRQAGHNFKYFNLFPHQSAHL